MRAGQLAKLGYIAFAIDMYGKGVRPKDVKDISSHFYYTISSRKPEERSGGFRSMGGGVR
jgi:dienelactone hydrolase